MLLISVFSRAVIYVRRNIVSGMIYANKRVSIYAHILVMQHTCIHACMHACISMKARDVWLWM